MKRRHLGWALAVGASLGVAALPSTEERASAGEPVDSVAIVEARAFLDEYQTSSEAASPLFYDLYSDRAMIHARIEGQEQGIVFQGHAYKQWGRDLAASRRAAPDASEFREATVEERGGRLVIRAKRYSVTRCFWDLHYAVGIEREGVSYRIVDEHLTTNPTGVCAPGRSASDPMAPPVTASVAADAGRESMIVAQRPPWRPLSPDEIAESARRLARQSAARNAGGVGNTAADVPLPARPAALTVATSPPETLWVMPTE